jgi:hypothetical protein
MSEYSSFSSVPPPPVGKIDRLPLQMVMDDIDAGLTSLQEATIEVSSRLNRLKAPCKAVPCKASDPCEKSLVENSDLVLALEAFRSRIRGTQAELLELLDRLQI